MKRIVILGGGGHGRVAAEIAELNGYRDIAFLEYKKGLTADKGPWPVIGQDDDATLEDLRQSSAFFVGLGENDKRWMLMERLLCNGLDVVTLTHPSAVVSSYADIGRGSLICAGAIISPFAAIGRGAIVNTNASVDHDCTLGQHVHIAPGVALAADVTVGDRAFVGIGAAVRNGVNIGAGSIIGAGSVVVADIAKDVTVYGARAMPAKNR